MKYSTSNHIDLGNEIPAEPHMMSNESDLAD